ncbi:MAG: hypothetical protein AAGK78_14600, partial [Planctomycetota bacterium]
MKTRLNQRMTRLSLASACAAVAFAVPAWLPAVAPQTAAVAFAQDNDELVDLVDDFYNAAAIGSYDAANAFGQAILDGGYDPTDLVDAFNEAHSRRNAPGEDLDRKLITWQTTEEIGDVTTKIVELVNEGRRSRATDPAFIRTQIERLSNGSLAYQNGLAQLRNSGGFAVPQMLQVLADSDQAAL